MPLVGGFELRQSIRLERKLIVSLFDGNAQIVNIPDANFKAKLLSADATPFNAFAFNFAQQAFKLDVNNDGEIQVSEALLVMQLSISYSNISDLTGIESFANLITLNCDHNQLSNLNVSIFAYQKMCRD